MKKRMMMHEDVLHSCFARFDLDGTGAITAHSLRGILGDSFEGSDVEELIREADCDGDGRVSYDDFLNYLQQEEDQSSRETSEDAIMAAPQSAFFDNDGPKSSASTVNEQSTRFRARREITEMIDGALPEKGSPEVTSRAPLTPKHPRIPSPVKQRKAISCFASRPVDATPEKVAAESSATATSTPPVGTSPSYRTPERASVYARGTTPDGDTVLLGPASNLCAQEPSPFSEPPDSARGSITSNRLDASNASTFSSGRWQQCARPRWPFWRPFSRDREPNRDADARRGFFSTTS